MIPVDSVVDEIPSRLDPESAEWIRVLAVAGPRRAAALAALRRAVDTVLTARQREVFVAIVVNDVPLDALALRLGSNRNAVYKMMFDARRKLRAALAANGYLDDDDSGRS